jgi:hypothetical protein
MSHAKPKTSHTNIDHTTAKYPRAPRPLIVVDEQTISNAERKNSGHCMVADAIRNCVSGAAAVSVDIQTIRFSDPVRRLRYVYLTPRAVQSAIVRFDQAEHNEPFQFKLCNAHVMDMTSRERKGAERKTPKKTQFRKTEQSGIPQRVGGKPPPSVSVRREFGLRAFR